MGKEGVHTTFKGLLYKSTMYNAIMIIKPSLECNVTMHVLLKALFLVLFNFFHCFTSIPTSISHLALNNHKLLPLILYFLHND